MARHAPRLIAPKGPSKATRQPTPGTVNTASSPKATSKMSSAGKPNQASSPNGGKVA